MPARFGRITRVLPCQQMRRGAAPVIAVGESLAGGFLIELAGLFGVVERLRDVLEQLVAEGGLLQ